jgi:hypothetical protein
MSSRQHRWTAAISMGLVLGALLACKKKKDAEPETAPSAAATPAAPATTSAAAATAAPAVAADPPGPKLGDVKRYPDKEKREDEAAVKILEDNVKVFNEADNTTPQVATLPKDLVVVRLASLEKEAFMLVDFPSGIGQFSPGWVETKFLEAKGEQVARDKVLSQDKKAAIQPSTKPSTQPDAGAPLADAGTKTDAGTKADAGSKTDAGAITIPKDVTDAVKKGEALAKDAGITLPPIPTTTSTAKKKKKD